jgi:hypothetical protein
MIIMTIDTIHHDMMISPNLLRRFQGRRRAVPFVPEG